MRVRWLPNKEYRAISRHGMTEEQRKAAADRWQEAVDLAGGLGPWWTTPIRQS